VATLTVERAQALLVTMKSPLASAGLGRRTPGNQPAVVYLFSLQQQCLLPVSFVALGYIGTCCVSPHGHPLVKPTASTFYYRKWWCAL